MNNTPNPSPFAGTDLGDRREATRYPAVDNTLSVGWTSGEHFVTTPAQVMDASRSGLLALADEEPAADGNVQVSLLAPAATGWIPVRVVEARRTRFGPFQLRLAFVDEPPAEFLEVVMRRSGGGEG